MWSHITGLDLYRRFCIKYKQHCLGCTIKGFDLNLAGVPVHLFAELAHGMCLQVFLSGHKTLLISVGSLLQNSSGHCIVMKKQPA